MPNLLIDIFKRTEIDIIKYLLYIIQINIRQFFFYHFIKITNIIKAAFSHKWHVVPDKLALMKNINKLLSNPNRYRTRTFYEFGVTDIDIGAFVSYIYSNKMYTVFYTGSNKLTKFRITSFLPQKFDPPTLTPFESVAKIQKS